MQNNSHSITADSYHQGEIYRVIVTGELTFSNHLDFSEIISNLVQKGVYKIMIDFSELVSIDSVGIGVLIKHQKMLHKNNGEMIIIRTPERVLELLIPVNIDKVFVFFPTLEEGLEYFSC